MNEDLTWWEQLATVLSGFATLALTIFAAVQLWNERKRRLAQERAALARITASAYALRRLLRSWLGTNERTAEPLEAWALSEYADDKLEGALAIGGSYARQMLEHAEDAPPVLAGYIRHAFVQFHEGAELVTSLARSRTTERNQRDQLRSMRLLNDASEHLWACSHVLAKHVVDPRVMEREEMARAVTESGVLNVPHSIAAALEGRTPKE